MPKSTLDALSKPRCLALDFIESVGLMVIEVSELFQGVRKRVCRVEQRETAIFDHREIPWTLKYHTSECVPFLREGIGRYFVFFLGSRIMSLRPERARDPQAPLGASASPHDYKSIPVNSTRWSVPVPPSTFRWGQPASIIPLAWIHPPTLPPSPPPRSRARGKRACGRSPGRLLMFYGAGAPMLLRALCGLIHPRLYELSFRPDLILHKVPCHDSSAVTNPGCSARTGRLPKGRITRLYFPPGAGRNFCASLLVVGRFRASSVGKRFGRNRQRRAATAALPLDVLGECNTVVGTRAPPICLRSPAAIGVGVIRPA